MPKAKFPLPVFLPGSNRSWDKVSGSATITADGEIHIKLDNQEDVDRLVEMAQERILLQLSFDYLMSDEVLERIINRHKVECLNPDCPDNGHCGGRCARVFDDRERKL